MLGDALLATLPRLQAEAESMMLDTVLAERPGPPTTDPDTGAVTGTFVEVYAGPARIKAVDASPAEVADSTRTLTADQCHVPVGEGPFQVGDRITVTDSASNPAIEGDVYRVTRLHGGAFITAQRLGVERWT